MAEENGHATDGMALPRQTVEFTIGNEKIPVPSLRFWDMDELKNELRAMTPETHWVDYAGMVLKIISHQLESTRPELTFDELKRRCSGGEAVNLAATMNLLLWASGFPKPAETAPASGIGTLTGYVSASPSGESAEEIPLS